LPNILIRGGTFIPGFVPRWLSHSNPETFPPFDACSDTNPRLVSPSLTASPTDDSRGIQHPSRLGLLFTRFLDTHKRQVSESLPKPTRPAPIAQSLVGSWHPALENLTNASYGEFQGFPAPPHFSTRGWLFLLLRRSPYIMI